MLDELQLSVPKVLSILSDLNYCLVNSLSLSILFKQSYCIVYISYLRNLVSFIKLKIGVVEKHVYATQIKILKFLSVLSQVLGIVTLYKI